MRPQQHADADVASALSITRAAAAQAHAFPARVSLRLHALRSASYSEHLLSKPCAVLTAASCRSTPQSSMVFCTNGILLRMLTQSQGLERVTHLVMDEVHERDCFADFLHIVLRQVRACQSVPEHCSGKSSMVCGEVGALCSASQAKLGACLVLKPSQGAP